MTSQKKKKRKKKSTMFQNKTREERELWKGNTEQEAALRVVELEFYPSPSPKKKLKITWM